MITVRSTPNSVAAAPWVVCPVKIRTNTSYFCSAVKNRFGLRGIAISVSPSLQGQQPCQTMLERTRHLSREVRRKPELAVLCLRVLQAALVYVNTLMIQDILDDSTWQQRLTAADRRGLSPLFWSHTAPYGEVRLNLDRRLQLRHTE